MKHIKDKKPDLSALAVKWQSAYVSRSEIYAFSGGIITSKTIANLDSLGVGPTGRIRVSRRICYPVVSLIAWLESRATLVN